MKITTSFSPPLAVVAACVLATFAVQLSAQMWDFEPDIVQGHPPPEDTRNEVVPGELIVDPPTLNNLGFRWLIDGDYNRNATVEVAFRKKGKTDWQEGPPMLRIQHEITARHRDRHHRTGNLFAGSVLFLEPETAYEVRLTLRDPDGGAPDEPLVFEAVTRGEPRAWTEGRTLTVYPPDWEGERGETDVFATLMDAYGAAEPGDVILLRAGIHPAEGAPYILRKGGLPGKPIVFRGEGAEKTILQGLDPSEDLFRIPGADHLMFEHLTLRGAESAIRTGEHTLGDKNTAGASWLTVRHCRIEDVRIGVWTFSEQSANWYIADNVIVGRDTQWYPRRRGEYMHGSHTGVNVYGQGHVVAYNRIRGFSDSLAVANYRPPPEDLHRQAMNIDFHNNDLSFAEDDTIEADYGVHNIRVYENLLRNTHTALSVQPSFGGPVYLIRNVAFGITDLLFKFNMAPAGILAYHNTLLSAGHGFRAPPWSNSDIRNNLILAGDGPLIDTGIFDPGVSTMDDNGWRVDPSVVDPIRWRHGRPSRDLYPDLAAFSAATGLETRGILVDFDIFVRAAQVERGRTYEKDDMDLALREDAVARNAGARLPGINNDFTGEAPDLGAYEFGRPRPHYGPRPLQKGDR